MDSGILTLLALLAFVAVVVWVFVIKRKEDFDSQAQLPLEDDTDQPEQHGKDNGNNPKENSS